MSKDMSTLTEIVSSKEVIIADASFGGTRDLCEEIYDCFKPVSIPQSILKEAVLSVSERLNLARQYLIYLPCGPLTEMKEGLTNLNSSLKFYRSGWKKSDKRWKNKDSFDEEDRKLERENTTLLTLITKSTSHLIRIFERRKVCDTFSEEENKYYIEMVKALKLLNFEGKPLKIDFSNRYNTSTYKSKCPLNLDSDEEVVASAIISANKSRTTILSDDSDIKRILVVALRDPRFYEKFWQVFPRNQLRLFSDYKKIGKPNITYNSDDPSLCEMIFSEMRNSQPLEN